MDTRGQGNSGTGVCAPGRLRQAPLGSGFGGRPVSDNGPVIRANSAPDWPEWWRDSWCASRSPGGRSGVQSNPTEPSGRGRAAHDRARISGSAGRFHGPHPPVSCRFAGFLGVSALSPDHCHRECPWQPLSARQHSITWCKEPLCPIGLAADAVKPCRCRNHSFLCSQRAGGCACGMRALPGVWAGRAE